MTTHLSRLLAVCVMLGSSYAFTSTSQADPLPGRDLLKFSQQPMINTTIVDTTGQAGVYYGHDEWSTLYGFSTAALPPQDYQGRFMADDFADLLTSPVVHVKWWGSYRHDYINPQMPVDKFAIVFESDIPAQPGGFSQPGQVLQFDVVNRAPVIAGPGSGTFTEKLIRGPDPLLGESLYEYNAELHFGREFFENKDTVYWLKIAAMVDVPPGIQFPPSQPPTFVTQWGWHNRDYTIQDTLASTPPNVVPGESNVGTIGTSPVWHFQDDAVEGDMRFNPYVQPAYIQQYNMQPTNYVDGVDGPAGSPAGTPGISQFSKDLAFEIFTLQIPEPATCTLVALGLVAVFSTRRRSV